MILLVMFHLFFIKIQLTPHLKHPPAISEGCEVTLKRITCTGTRTLSAWGGVSNQKENMVWKGLCVLIKRIHIRVESSCPFPISLLSLSPPLHFPRAHLYPFASEEQ